jgi:hypothetical protein
MSRPVDWEIFTDFSEERRVSIFRVKSNVQEDLKLYQHRCEHLKSRIVFIVSPHFEADCFV